MPDTAQGRGDALMGQGPQTCPLGQEIELQVEMLYVGTDEQRQEQQRGPTQGDQGRLLRVGDICNAI